MTNFRDHLRMLANVHDLIRQGIDEQAVQAALHHLAKTV